MKFQENDMNSNQNLTILLPWLITIILGSLLLGLLIGVAIFMCKRRRSEIIYLNEYDTENIGVGVPVTDREFGHPVMLTPTSKHDHSVMATPTSKNDKFLLLKANQN